MTNCHWVRMNQGTLRAIRSRAAFVMHRGGRDLPFVLDFSNNYIVAAQRNDH